ncbi:MAG: acyl carrier protein [Candidatus Omnitrophota bacterium]|nr:acyl carrier protein [Candidatus Omnitrophota bacterium]
MMDATTIAQEVRSLIADILEMEPSQIDPDAHLVEDLGMDSMMALEILAPMDKKFKIKIPEEDLPKITTLSGAVELAKKYVK